jgi:hypothetical protein
VILLSDEYSSVQASSSIKALYYSFSASFHFFLSFPDNAASMLFGQFIS